MHSFFGCAAPSLLGGLFSRCGGRDCSLVAGRRLLLCGAQAPGADLGSAVGACGLLSSGSVVMTCRLR